MKNKKVLIIAIVAVVVVLAVVLGVALAGNGSDPTTTTTTKNPGPQTQTYKLGMGVAFGGHSATESNATVATVVLDKDGKIVACRLDVAQNKYGFDEDEEDVVFANLLSKAELGEDYHMDDYGQSMDWNGDGVVKEWYAQAKAFEEFVVGKTAAEVEALTVVQNGSHWVSNDPVLSAGCTMDIVDFKAAVVKACKDEQGMSFETDKTFTLGLGINSANDSSSAEDEENYLVKMNVEFAASVVIDGKVVATVNDAYQPNITVEDGEVVLATVGTFAGQADKNNVFNTKRELKKTYGMDAAHVDKNGDDVSLEWYLQSKAYSEHVVGKTAAEIAGLVADDALLEADCTIYIGGINAVVAESVTNAR